MDIGGRIRELRENLKLTQEEVGKRIGVTKATINRYETGEIDIKRTVALKLSELFNVSPAYIMGWSDSPVDLPKGAEPYNPIVHQIPILGTISAGLPIYAEQNIEGYTYTERNSGAEYFALRVKGDSMNAAKINEGDLLIVRKQPEVENGEIAVVLVNRDDATVKRFKRDGNIVQLIPQSYNPIHQIQIYDLKTDEISIVGKVVECKIEF